MRKARALGVLLAGGDDEGGGFLAGVHGALGHRRQRPEGLLVTMLCHSSSGSTDEGRLLSFRACFGTLGQNWLLSIQLSLDCIFESSLDCAKASLQP